MSNMKTVSLIAATDRKQRADFGEVLQQLMGALADHERRIVQLRADVDRLNPWRRVVFSADCNDDGDCPICKTDFAECGCPGPTMEDHEYADIGGILHARKSG